MNSSAIDLRPKTWDEVIGQEHVVTGIRNKLKTGVPPAWLFIGPSGSGKTTIAEILSRYVQETDANSEFLDIRRINAADRNGVDDARALAEESKYHPAYGKYRVIIMDEAHMLTPAAQNTLLIPTEAANSPTIWIFCTTDPGKLLPTLRSRCVTFELKPFGKKEIIQLMASLSSNLLASDSEASFLTAVCEKGLTSPRDILYAWDKYVSGVPLDEAIDPPPENNPVYTEIAKAAVKGDWNKTSEALKTLKTPDVKGLKSVLGWFFKSELLNSGMDAHGDAVAEALIRMGNISAFEDGTILAALTGILYHYSRKRSKP